MQIVSDCQGHQELLPVSSASYLITLLPILGSSSLAKAIHAMHGLEGRAVKRKFIRKMVMNIANIKVHIS